MEPFLITIIIAFLAFCVTAIALSSQHAGIQALALKILGKLSLAVPSEDEPKVESK